MKRFTLNIIIAAFAMCSLSGKISNAQTIADFENLTIPVDSFWNGSDMMGVFISGNASFENKFVDWGGGITSWSGFAYTNMRDSLTQSYTNEFSAIKAVGYNASNNYAVGYVSAFDPLPRIRLNGIAKGDTVSGFYVTNSTYGYLTMKNGGGIAKKFGGVSGTDPDWFVLVVYGYYDGIKKTDSVSFYLADYRFTDSAQDYLVKEWQWIDLTSLGKVDSLEFNMFSSDTGTYGINNPTYFCLDNLITNHNSSMGIQENIAEKFSLYPNPATDMINILTTKVSKTNEIKILDLSGRIVAQFNNVRLPRSIDISNLTKGVYFIQINSSTNKFVVQ